MTDDEIDTRDIPQVTPEQFARAIVRRGLESVPPKAQLTIRVDLEVLDWFRKQGRGYQTRINALLRAYMEAHKKDGEFSTQSRKEPQRTQRRRCW